MNTRIVKVKIIDLTIIIITVLTQKKIGAVIANSAQLLISFSVVRNTHWTLPRSHLRTKLMRFYSGDFIFLPEIYMYYPQEAKILPFG